MHTDCLFPCFYCFYYYFKDHRYSRDLNDTFSQQLPRFMDLPRSEGVMCIYATSTSFCSLSLINPTVYGKSTQDVENS